MTRPLDQADVDAVLEARYGPDSLGDLTPAQMHAVRSDALSWLNAAVALGWTPPTRPGDATFTVHLDGLKACLDDAADWRDHPVVLEITSALHGVAENYDGIDVDISGKREPGGAL